MSFATPILFAVAGYDYVALSDFQIRWLADQVDPRYIPVPTDRDPVFQISIIDDDIPEDLEYFEIQLTLNDHDENTGNGFFYPYAVGRVTIVDDDICKLLIQCINSNYKNKLNLTLKLHENKLILCCNGSFIITSRKAHHLCLDFTFL